MFRRFLRDTRGNYLMITALVMPVLFGSLAIGVDYADMSRQRQSMLNALDAAGMATSRRLLEGGSDTVVKTYAKNFFESNLNGVNPKDITLTVTLPANISGGGRVKLDAVLKFNPYFLPTFLGLLGKDPPGLYSRASTTIQLKNTVEVALVLDNSGSMNDKGKGTGDTRLKLLQTAAKQLVDQLAATASLMVQVEKPVQFSVVPFAASVNIGNSDSNATAQWMDTQGLSSIHHENFDWGTMPSSSPDLRITRASATDPYKKTGQGWSSAEKNQVVTRFQLFKDLKRTVCSRNSCTTQPYAEWRGCVEARPSPYNTNDEPAVSSKPDTLYVPMFAPDENDLQDGNGRSAYNNWWSDVTTSTSGVTRQRYAYKYYSSQPQISAATGEQGPNGSCTTTAITPLTDVTTTAGKNTVKAAIDAMAANGATNVPEGMAWGWRTLSSIAPFTGGRSEVERGNDKVVIVLTDGANTYYTPDYFPRNDLGNNKSTYSAFGYARLNTTGTEGRIFKGTSTPVSYSNSQYTTAMNQHFLKLCENANGGETGKPGAGLIIMTVALDLDSAVTADKNQMAMLETCASRSRYSKDPKDPSKGRKLYWNATGANLSQVFREIADELSNLRFVS